MEARVAQIGVGPVAVTVSQLITVIRISDALSLRRLWYGKPHAIDSAVDYAKFFSRSHAAVIRVYDAAGNVIEAHQHAGDFNVMLSYVSVQPPFVRVPQNGHRLAKDQEMDRL